MFCVPNDMTKLTNEPFLTALVRQAREKNAYQTRTRRRREGSNNKVLRMKNKFDISWRCRVKFSIKFGVDGENKFTLIRIEKMARDKNCQHNGKVRQYSQTTIRNSFQHSPRIRMRIGWRGSFMIATDCLQRRYPFEWTFHKTSFSRSGWIRICKLFSSDNLLSKSIYYVQMPFRVNVLNSIVCISRCT